MTILEMYRLRRGDIVRHKGTGTSYLVSHGYDGDRVTLVRTTEMFRSDEWDLVPQIPYPYNDKEEKP